MENLKKKITKKLEKISENDKAAVVMTKDTYLDNKDEIDQELGDDTVIKIVDEQSVDEVNQKVLNKFEDQYGEKEGENIYYATANKQDRSPETFHTETADWDELGDVTPPNGVMNEEDDEANGSEEGNVNMDKMRRDVKKFIDKLNLSQFSNILAKIDTPLEKAEVIAAFAEVIGVPREKLPLVIRMLKTQTESVNPRMTKNNLVEHVLKNRKK